MKKEMKHALVALGLSTLLVPTFASQVVFAQEESHETAISTTQEEIKKMIEETKNDLQNFKEQVKHRLFEQIDKGEWDIVSISKSDVSSIRDKLTEELDNRLRDSMGDLENLRNISLEDLSNVLSDFKKSKKIYINGDGEKGNFFDYRMKYGVAKLAILKKKDLVISQVNNDSHYTELEKKEMLDRVSRY